MLGFCSRNVGQKPFTSPKSVPHADGACTLGWTTSALKKKRNSSLKPTSPGKDITAALRAKGGVMENLYMAVSSSFFGCAVHVGYAINGTICFQNGGPSWVRRREGAG